MMLKQILDRLNRWWVPGASVEERATVDEVPLRLPQPVQISATPLYGPAVFHGLLNQMIAAQMQDQEVWADSTPQYSHLYINEQCHGCHYYHGKEGVVCGVHPFGPDREGCGDFLAKQKGPDSPLH